MNHQLAGLLIGLANLVGYIAMARKMRLAWPISFCVEIGWMLYSSFTGQWGLFATCFPFMAVFIYGWFQWRESEPADVTRRPGAPTPLVVKYEGKGVLGSWRGLRRKAGAPDALPGF